MIPARIGSILLIPLLSAAVGAQEPANGVSRKQAVAVRVADGAIRVDGRLDDLAWRQASPIRDFIQKEPTEGAAPSEDLEVRFVYDESALYVGARMYNRELTTIQAPMGRRDSVSQAEHIMVSLDTFLDRRTAYAFGVTASGVRVDRFYEKDAEETWDEGFDPVWEAQTSIDDDGWTAELWIPFSQLRFNERPEQVFGLNVQRFTPTLNELDYWVPVPRTERGWASHFGDLRGIQGVRPTRRIELLPYVAGASTVNAHRDRGNPFDDGRNLASRVGVDVKMGLGPNLTLDATVNPDFGQVEADPAEVNLTDLETLFTEKRPFFTEGADLLNLANQENFFYSRRVGARPIGPASGDYVDYPRASTISAAAKLTGRLTPRTSLGAFGAFTDDESARISTDGSPLIRTVRVAPQTAYGVARIQREFGSLASWFSVMATGVRRDLKAGDPLAALLVRNAVAVAGEALLRFKRGEYELRPYAGVSNVAGEPAAIERVQRSSVRYMQRPDNDYSAFDPTRRSLSGFKSGFRFERTSGRHWLWNTSADAETPGLELNDVGRLRTGDGIRGDATLRYRETNPGKIFRTYAIALSQTNEWNFGGDRQIGTARANITLQFLNFWTFTLATGPDFQTLDVRLTRGGPLMATPPGWTTTVTLQNRPSAQTGWNGRLNAATDDDGGRVLNLEGGLSFRPGPRWQLSVRPGYVRETSTQQYVTTLDRGGPDTYGKRYIFSYIDRSTISTQLRLNFTFKPDLNLDVYAEPFAASGRYYDFGELARARTRERLLYGSSGTTATLQPDGSRIITDGGAAFTLKNYDFNVRSFRSNVVLRWEWRPGSTLYAVWQQDRRVSESVGGRVGLGDMFGSLTVPGSNFFVVKTSFWLPVR